MSNTYPPAFDPNRKIAEDRGLGQGYFINSDKIPLIKRSLWSKEKKLQFIVNLFNNYEKMLHNTDLLIHQYPDKIRNTIVGYNKGKVKCMVQARFGDRYMWSDNNFLTSSELIKSVHILLDTFVLINCKSSENILAV